MRSIAFTLFEGDYHLGAGVLLNSLQAADFRGTFVAVCRGGSPGWLDRLLGSAVSGIAVDVVDFRKQGHLAQAKPSVALELFDRFSTCNKLFYFDPDIVVRREWSFFDEWASCGFCVIEEIVKRGMSDRHPQRLLWDRWARANGFDVRRTLGRYYNSGFFALDRAQADILTKWRSVLEHCTREGHKVTTAGGYREKYASDAPLPMFTTWDQDALNLALMLSGAPISDMGPEEMDFLPSGVTMSHAVGPKKPWRKSYLLEAINGNPPKRVDREFWRNAESPVPVFSAATAQRKRVAIRAAAFLSRFYSRRS